MPYEPLIFQRKDTKNGRRKEKPFVSLPLCSFALIFDSTEKSSTFSCQVKLLSREKLNFSCLENFSTQRRKEWKAQRKTLCVFAPLR
jgi:hypothetical protein